MTRRELLASHLAMLILRATDIVTAEEKELFKRNDVQPGTNTYFIDQTILSIKDGTQKILAQHLNVVFDPEYARNPNTFVQNNVQIGRLVGPHEDVKNFFDAACKFADIVITFDVDNVGTIEHTFQNAIIMHCGMQVHSGDPQKPKPEDMIIAENLGIVFSSMGTRVIQKPLTETLQHEARHTK